MKTFLVTLALVAACSAQLEFELGRSHLFSNPILTYSYIPQVLPKETSFIKEVKIDLPKEVKIDLPKKVDSIKDVFLPKPVEDTDEVKLAKAEFMIKFKEEELKHLLAKKDFTFDTKTLPAFNPLMFYKPWEPIMKSVKLGGLEKEPIVVKTIEKNMDSWPKVEMKQKYPNCNPHWMDCDEKILLQRDSIVTVDPWLKVLSDLKDKCDPRFMECNHIEKTIKVLLERRKFEPIVMV